MKDLGFNHSVNQKKAMNQINQISHNPRPNKPRSTAKRPMNHEPIGTIEAQSPTTYRQTDSDTIEHILTHKSDHHKIQTHITANINPRIRYPIKTHES